MRFSPVAHPKSFHCVPTTVALQYAACMRKVARGSGATTAIFSLLNAVLLRPLPFPDPQRLMWAQQADIEPGAAANTTEPLSYPDFFDWRARSQAVAGMASYRHDRLTLTGSGEPHARSTGRLGRVLPRARRT